MAIVQISRIQVRRGLQQDLPQLASGEFGWSLDQRRLFIGNGTLDEGAPTEGLTEILTQYTDVFSIDTLYTFKGLAPGPAAITGPDVNNPVYRPLQDKLDDFLSVKDYGAIGDGIADDTVAINRALIRQSQAPNHRTIYFPAGTYRVTSTIDIPPYSRITGDGKGSTVIVGSFAGPLAQFVDSYGQSGVLYGNPDGLGNRPQIVEYHLTDVAFYQQCPTYDQPVLLIDGGFTATFTRVSFRGLLKDTTGDYAITAVCTGTAGAYTFTTTDATGIVNGMAIGYYYDEAASVALGGTVQSVTGPVGGLYTITTNVANADNFTDATILFSDRTNTSNPVFDVDRGPGIAGVTMSNRSALQSVKNFVFNQCDFWQIGNAVEMNEDCHAISFLDCYFDQCYHYIVMGNDTSYSGGAFVPYDISITHNYFRYCADIGIDARAGVTNIMSSFNTYIGYGTQDYYADYPVVNQNGVAATPAISFNGKNNYSIGDSFFDEGAFPTVPYIVDNGYLTYQIIQDIGVVNGRKTIGHGKTLTLEDSATFVTCGFDNIPVTYTNLVVDYKINHAGGERIGKLTVAGVGGMYVTDEEYTENSNVGVALRANSTTGDIEYTSIVSGPAAVLTYSLTYLTA